MPHPGPHACRLASLALCTTLTLTVASSAAAAEHSTYPQEGSSLTRLAEDAMDDDRMALVRDRANTRTLYLNAFLIGFTNPAGNISGNPTSPSVVGMNDGKAYRKDHPDDVGMVLSQFGYEPIEVTGSWRTAYELNQFYPDRIRVRTISELQKPCWEFDAVRSRELAAAFALVIGPQDLQKVSTHRFRVKGFLGPLVPANQIGAGSCVRKIFAVMIEPSRRV